MDWVHGKESTESFIMWLHGAAGAGKSAIAQGIAELCHEEDVLLASFFASNRAADARQMDANYIFPTIAYQISTAIPDMRPMIEEVIARDPLIFTRTLQTQIDALIIKPLKQFVTHVFSAGSAPSPRLVIIDGLDEISDRSAQVKVLEVICHALQHHHVQLIFLISSRPEQDIAHAFSMEPLRIITGQLLLDGLFDPHRDIRLFLEESFTKIKNSHQHKKTIPSDWPPWRAVDNLVIKASGQFIYPSTVVRFVESTQHRPADQLDIILGLRPIPKNDSSPYGELDALYMRILSVDSVKKFWHQIVKILGALLTFQHPRSRSLDALEEFLGLQRGDSDLYLADMVSLISLDPKGKEEPHLLHEEPHLLHASFRDFLLDPARSGEFSISTKSMNTMMVCCCLQHLINFPEQHFSKCKLGVLLYFCC